MTYSGNVKLLLESTLASDANAIKKAISKLGASGSTAGGEALKMAYEEALANFSFYFLSLHSQVCRPRSNGRIPVPVFSQVFRPSSNGRHILPLPFLKAAMLMT